jgi:hypothetical protein
MMGAHMSMLKGANTPVPTAALRVEVGRRSGPSVPDVDASALLLAGGRVRSDGDLVFHNQPQHVSGAVRHEGERDAGGRVTDTLLVDLVRVAPGIHRPAGGPLPGPHARSQPAAHRRPRLRLGHELDPRPQMKPAPSVWVQLSSGSASGRG